MHREVSIRVRHYGVSYLVNLMHTFIWTGSRWDISCEVGHDIIFLIWSHS